MTRDRFFRFGLGARFILLYCMMFTLNHVVSAQTPDSNISETSLVQLQEQIHQFESQYDAYSPELGEAVLALAQQYKKLKLYDAALQTYERALSIEKINRGLYDTNLLPLYQQIIDTALAAKYWKTADDLMAQLVWMNNNSFEMDDDRRIPILEAAARWHFAAAEERMDEFGFQHLLTAQQAFEELIKLENSELKNIEFQMSVAMTNQQFLLYLQRKFDPKNPRSYQQSMDREEARQIEGICDRRLPRPTQNELIDAGLTSGAFGFYDPVEGTVGNKVIVLGNQMKSYVSFCNSKLTTKAEELIEQLNHSVERLDNDQVREQFIQFQGDWFLLNGDEERAKEFYAQLFQLKREHSAPDETTLELPPQPIESRIYISGLPQLKRETEQEMAERIPVEFDLTDKGVVENVRARGEVDEKTIELVKKELAEEKFRPLLLEAGPQMKPDNLCWWSPVTQSCREYQF